MTISSDFLLLVARRRRRRRGRCGAPGSSLPTVTGPSGRSAVALCSSRVWLERSTRPSGSNLSERLGDAVEVEVGGELHPRPAGADDPRRRWPRSGRAGAARRRSAARRPAGDCAASSPARRRRAGGRLSSTTDTRCGFRPLTAAATRWRIARTCWASSAAAHLQHDRGGGLDLVAREQRALRQHQVHARGLHPVDGADGARQLAFERAQVIDVLHEAGGARARRTCRRSRSRSPPPLGRPPSASFMRRRVTRSFGTSTMAPSFLSS